MSFALNSPCKVNLLLNILGRRPDGFHELETVLHPVPLHDVLSFERGGQSVQLSCSEPSLPVDSTNLVHRAAVQFLNSAGIKDGVRIHLDKNLPMAAGLGGGSSNAAVTLLGLNKLFGAPLDSEALNRIAAALGSDVPFFLQAGPALGTGRGERIQAVPPFEALQGSAILLIRPGFGVSTPWAYCALANHTDALNGRKGRSEELVKVLRAGELGKVGPTLFNSLEAPVFHKYPLLALLKEFLLKEGTASLMSGSGSTTFAIAPSTTHAERLREKVLGRFGSTTWTAITPL